MAKSKIIHGNLPDMIRAAQDAGYTHVITLGGPVPLTEWKPYSHSIPPLEFVMYVYEANSTEAVELREKILTVTWSRSPCLALGRW